MSLFAQSIFFLLLSSVFASTAFSSEAYDSAKECLPESFSEAKVRSQYTDDGTTYLFIGGMYDFSTSVEYATSLISVENDTCETLIAHGDFDTNFFDVVDFEVEKELFIGNLEYVISLVGSKDELQSLLFEDAQLDAITERSDAEVQAMEELDLEVPPFYNSITSDPTINLLIRAYQNSQVVPTPKFVNNIRVSDSYSIAEWHTKDGSSGLLLAQLEAESWQVIGHTTQQDESPSPEQLNSEFGVPLDLANKLLEAD